MRVNAAQESYYIFERVDLNVRTFVYKVGQDAYAAFR